MISYREAQQHLENIGNQNVYIEPHFQYIIKKAVDELNQQDSNILRNVSDIIGRIDKSVFGEYSTSTSNTIYINIQRIQDEVKRKIGTTDQEQVEAEILRQIKKTIVHEATHLNEYQSTGYTSEYKPEEAEKTIK